MTRASVNRMTETLAVRYRPAVIGDVGVFNHAAWWFTLDGHIPRPFRQPDDPAGR